MINYVNNSFDKVLKPCDAQRFSILVNSQQTERLILGHRGGDSKAKAKLPAITYMGVLDSDKYRKYLDHCKEQDTKPQGSRRAEFMRPTGLLMLDFDHVGGPMASPRGLADNAEINTPVKLWEYIKERVAAMPASSSSGGVEGAPSLALAHITPSGDGLRLVLKRTKGKTIEQEQYEFCKAMDLESIGIRLDGVCKDISRLSFVPMQREILYFNPDLLFGELPDPQDYPDGSLWTGTHLETPSNSPSMGRTADIAGVNNDKSPEALPIDGADADGASVATTGDLSPQRSAEGFSEGQRGSYGGIDYKDIVSRLEEQLGGRPERGARNAFIFTMACHLRYICNDDPDWGRNIPRYGDYGEDFARELQPYIDALNLCRGTIHSPEAEAWAERMLDEQLTHAEQSDDRAYATLSFRAVLMGFLRAMTLYVMCDMQWTDEISEFAAWTVRYDMWCKMHFFGDLLHQDLEAEANAAVANPRNLLGMLPHEFTRQDAQELRIAQGRNANPKNMLAQWTHRGYITYDEQRGVYVKSRA